MATLNGEFNASVLTKSAVSYSTFVHKHLHGWHVDEGIVLNPTFWWHPNPLLFRSIRNKTDVYRIADKSRFP